MKLIPLSQGKFAQVDDEDFEYLNQWKWSIAKSGNINYAERRERDKITKKDTAILMHRFIIGTPKGLDTDHIDKDGLNNQKNNLRICTRSENLRNRASHKDSTSKYLGVSRSIEKHYKKMLDGSIKEYVYSYWVASICHNKTIKRIGIFKTEENAAIAYNIFAEKYHGEFANYNK